MRFNWRLRKIKMILNIVVVIVLCLWLLSVFGLLDGGLYLGHELGRPITH
jgi:hypothetical protein